MLDLTFDFATAPTGESKTWKNKKIRWADFVRKLSTPYHTKESYKEFLSFTKEEQAKIKDVGAYFGGYIRTGRRLKSNIVHRQLITLDIDLGYVDFWEDYTLSYSCASVLHSTHKHCEVNPRYRLIIPLDREVTPDEYTAISRRIAGNIGIDYFDGTTFDINRFMYWQSTPRDVEYVFEHQDGEPLCADDVLAEYTDWTDISLYPRTIDETQREHKAADKAEDPMLKKGIVGAFCRTYTIQEAIEHYLPDVYTQVEDGVRFTFEGGTTSGGAVVYDDKYLFSHHNTDPCSNRLVNAYDLVRLHLFEGESDTKSMQLMEEKALEDAEVKKTLARERLSMVDLDFEGIDFEDFDLGEDSKELDWMSTLEADKKGNYHPTAGNFTKIIKNDSRLKNLFQLNAFSQRICIMRSPPWRSVSKPQNIKDVDFAGLRNYIERIYGISSPQKIEDAVKITAEKNKFHPLQDYLNSLEWDGEPRINQMFQYWLGCDDTKYISDCAKELVIGAVMRAFHAGCKYDTVVTFVGVGGAGKSTLISKLGGEWFSETLTTVHGKEGMEQIQGFWIIEMSELAGLRAADINAQKAFVAKSCDNFRPAYGRTLEDFPRQCIFVASTNEDDFLKETKGKGNRRWPPVKVYPYAALDHPFNMKKEYIDQIWAEAVYLFRTEGYVPLTGVEDVQDDFIDKDPRTGEVEAYLSILLPSDWHKVNREDRLFYLDTYKEEDIKPKDRQKGLFVRRATVSPIEVYLECFRGRLESYDRIDQRNIRDILTNLGWEAEGTPRKTIYGSQRVYSFNYKN